MSAPVQSARSVLECGGPLPRSGQKIQLSARRQPAHFNPMTQPATPLLSEPGQTNCQRIDRSLRYFARFVIVVMSLFLMAGCSHTPTQSLSDEARIARCLQERITPEGARHMLLKNIDHMTQTIQKRASTAATAAERGDYQTQLEVLARTHQKLSLALESFLSGFLEKDELWTYRTLATSDRASESGIAIVRDGKVIQHMAFAVYD